MAPLHDVSVATEKATFCMGCYWAPECTFGVLAGVVRTRVGHAGPDEAAPVHECHEAIEVDFDPGVVSYQQLLDVFWLHHDPTLAVPCEYASAILYHNPAQRELAECSLAEQQRQRSPVHTKVLPAKVFHEAESKNQKYRLQQHPWLMEAVGLTGAPAGPSAVSLQSSHVAARLNGYVVGAGGAARFEQEVANLGLSPAAAEYVGKLVREHQGGGGGCARKKDAGGVATAASS